MDRRRFIPENLSGIENFEPKDLVTPESLFLRQELRKEFEKLLEKYRTGFYAKQWVMMYIFDGLKYADIARKYKYSPNVIRNKVRWALGKIDPKEIKLILGKK